MTFATVRAILAWSSVINLGILLIWFLVYMLAGEWLYCLHGKWFRISREGFDALHYGGMGLYKLGILLFNLVPYLVMRLAVCG